jgi:predicted transcriptional regulator
MPRSKTLEVQKEHKIDVPLLVKLSQAQSARLEELCSRLGRSKSELVREAIMALLGVYYGKGQEDALAQTMDKGVAGREH